MSRFALYLLRVNRSRTAGSLVDALTEEAPDGFGLSAEDAQLLVAAAGTKGGRDEEFTWQHYVRFLSVGGFELVRETPMQSTHVCVHHHVVDPCVCVCVCPSAVC